VILVVNPSTRSFLHGCRQGADPTSRQVGRGPLLLKAMNIRREPATAARPELLSRLNGP
jgi:hypothetical protein